MAELQKERRRRAANFSSYEKALLKELIKVRSSVVKTNSPDGTTMQKKKIAWNSITKEFNSHAHIHKRGKTNLKNAWNNFKHRKILQKKRGTFMKTTCGPLLREDEPQKSVAIDVQMDAPDIEHGIQNTYDNDSVYRTTDNMPEDPREDTIDDEYQQVFLAAPIVVNEVRDSSVQIDSTSEPQIPLDNNIENAEEILRNAVPLTESEERQCIGRKASYYIRQEAMLRVKHTVEKNKLEMEILKLKLEAQEKMIMIADLEEATKKIIYEKARLELDELKANLGINQRDEPWPRPSLSNNI